MGNIFLHSRRLPLTIKPKRRRKSFNALIDIAVSNKDIFVSQLLRYGALLFRGFEIEDSEQFSEFVKKFSGKEFNNSVEKNLFGNALVNNIYGLNDFEFHNKFFDLVEPPRNSYLFCEAPPQKGGETILGDCRRILSAIRPKIVGLFKHKKILFELNLTADINSPYAWQRVFKTVDKLEAEEFCRQINAEFEWKKNGFLVVRQLRSAISKDSKTSEDVWSIQMQNFYSNLLDKENTHHLGEEKVKPHLNSFFGDGSPICVLMLEHIRKVLRKESVSHRWEKGDILILDNILTTHSQNAVYRREENLAGDDLSLLPHSL